MNLYTTADVARELGIAPQLVRRLADRHGLGQRLNPRMLVFTDAEVDVMRNRNRNLGRPARSDPALH